MSAISNEVSAIPHPLPALGDSFGALYIGLLFAAILYGFTNLQVIKYLQKQWKYDRAVYRIMVGWLWLLETVHLTFISHMLYHHLITNFANPLSLSVIVWSFKAQIVTIVIIIFSVHCLYAHRLWILGKGRKRIFFLVYIVVIIITSGFSIIMCYFMYRRHLYSELQNGIWATIVALSMLAFNDFFVAGSMCYLLAFSRTGFSKTDTTIKKLILYVCSSGCLTSFCSMVVIITCVAMPHNSIYLATDFLLSKLYVNSVIALLNSRDNAGHCGDVRISTLRATPHLVKCQDDEEHRSYLEAQLRGRRSQQTLCANAQNRKNSAGDPLDLDLSDISDSHDIFPNRLPTSTLTL